MTRPADLTPDYLAAVERALLAGTGRGLMLSAIDLHHVHRWARAGVPAEVVVAGVEKAFATRPRTTRGLAYAAPAVDAAIKAWLERRVGGEVGAPEVAATVDAELLDALDRLMARLVDAGLRHQAPVRIVLRETWKSLNALKERCVTGLEPDPIAALALLDTATFEALWAVTPEAIRAGIDAGVDASLRQDASLGGTEDVRFFRRWKGLRAHFGLPALVLEMGGGW